MDLKVNVRSICVEYGEKRVSYGDKTFYAQKNNYQNRRKVEKILDSAPSYGIVRKRFTEFCCGCMSTIDAEHSGCRIEIMTEEMVNKIFMILC